MSDYNNRKAAMAKVARNRAAHFARPEEDVDSSIGSNRKSCKRKAEAHQQNKEEDNEWCGPFTVARRLLRNRGKAKQEREEQIRAAQEGSTEEESDGDEKLTIQWEPRGRGSMLNTYNTPKCLQELCLAVIADNFETMDGLSCLHPTMIRKLSRILCNRLKLTDSAMRKLTGLGATEVVLPDCSRIGPCILRSSLLNCRKTLSVLDLQFCGRCINDGTMSAFTLAGGFPALSKLCLGGTYRLSDSVLVPFLLLSPNLCHLDLRYYNHFHMKGFQLMAKKFGSSLISLGLDFCLGMTSESLSMLPQFTKLQRLSLRGAPTLTDGAISAALNACGSFLRDLDVEECSNLGDGTLEAISTNCRCLQSLAIGLNRGFGYDALCSLFTSPQANRQSFSSGLKKLSLKNLHSVDDDIVSAIATRFTNSLVDIKLCSCTGITDASLISLARCCCKSLASIDLSFCRGVSDRGLGYFVDQCTALKEMKLWGNMQISNVFLEGHTGSALRISYKTLQLPTGSLVC